MPKAPAAKSPMRQAREIAAERIMHRELEIEYQARVSLQLVNLLLRETLRLLTPARRNAIATAIREEAVLLEQHTAKLGRFIAGKRPRP